MDRRSFLTTTAVGVALASRGSVAAPGAHVATNTYPWTTFAARDGGTM